MHADEDIQPFDNPDGDDDMSGDEYEGGWDVEDWLSKKVADNAAGHDGFVQPDFEDHEARQALVEKYSKCGNVMSEVCAI